MSYGTRVEDRGDYRRHMASQFMQCTVGGEGGHWQVHQTEAVEMACNAPHTCACHNILTHVHLSSSIPMCSPNLSTHMHRRPDSEVFNMSPFGTNLSALRHHLAAGAVEGHSVPLFNSTSWMGVSVTGLCIKCWTHFGHLREEGQRIQCY